jgi:hypothetical protein
VWFVFPDVIRRPLETKMQTLNLGGWADIGHRYFRYSTRMDLPILRGVGALASDFSLPGCLVFDRRIQPPTPERSFLHKAHEYGEDPSLEEQGHQIDELEVVPSPYRRICSH